MPLKENLSSFIPEKGLQVVRYCGYHSNKARGLRPKRQPGACTAVAVSAPEAEPHGFRRQSKRAWARLIRKVRAEDSLACPKCGARLRIISFIEDRAIIENIFRHLKLWDLPARPPPPRAHSTLEMDADLVAWKPPGCLMASVEAFDTMP